MPRTCDRCCDRRPAFGSTVFQSEVYCMSAALGRLQRRPPSCESPSEFSLAAGERKTAPLVADRDRRLGRPEAAFKAARERQRRVRRLARAGARAKCDDGQARAAAGARRRRTAGRAAHGRQHRRGCARVFYTSRQDSSRAKAGESDDAKPHLSRTELRTEATPSGVWPAVEELGYRHVTTYDHVLRGRPGGTPAGRARTTWTHFP